MLENKVFGMISLGCDKNRVDGERLLGRVRERGYAITNDLGEAQILIVNTCAFLESARKEAIDTILEADGLRSGRLEKIVVSGCLSEKFIGELFPELTEGDVFLGCGDADVLLEGLEKSYAENARVNLVGKGKEEDPLNLSRVVTTPLHYAYLKIAEGCSNRCAYCLIPKIRGKYRSEPMDALVREAESLGDLSELIVVAQDISRYGKDLYGEYRLVELLQRLTALENIERVRLLYCYPDVIGEEFIRELASNDKIVKYLDIPLQHSEDEILKRMRRPGTRESYARLLETLRERVPGIAIRTTFIAGFPGETEEDVDRLCEFLREQKFFNCGFFAYSREPETPAYDMPDQIPAREKKRRVRKLYAVQREISKARMKEYVGKTVRVLCDGIDYERNCFTGRAYFSAPEIDGCVYFRAPHARQGETCSVIIDRADSYDLYGHTEDYE